jgi:sialate O-acetylesterase
MEYQLGGDWSAQAPADGKVPVNRQQEAQFYEMVMDPEKFRFFAVERCASGAEERSCVGSWKKMLPEYSKEVSAVGAWFGLGLQYDLDVPVGIIVSAWGGTVAEAWMSYQALAAEPETRQLAEMSRSSHWKSKFWTSSRDENTLDYSLIPGVRKNPENKGIALGYAETDFDDSSWSDMNVPGSWIEQHICGNGVLWARKTVDIPESWANCPLVLQGGAVDKHDVSYFNGKEIGAMGKDFEVQFYNTRRHYPIAPELVKAGNAVVAIRAFSFSHDGSINGNWTLVNEKNGEKIELDGVWKAFSEADFGKVVHRKVCAEAIGTSNPNSPCILFNGMLRPLIPYAIRGVIWYQGESNAGSLETSRAYRDILQAMIDDWRRQWGQPGLPFIMVQLAGYNQRESFYVDSCWAELRESQRLLAATDPDTYMASAIDVGEEKDIHPQNKFDVGKRLAMCALHHIYGKDDIVPSGPEAVKAEFAGNRVEITFKYAENLTLRSEENAFYLAGKDGVFYAADKAEVKDDKLILVSDKIAEVSEVRYAWANFPVTVLFNGVGFPASSFRFKAGEK